MDHMPPFVVTALAHFADQVMKGEPSQILGMDLEDPYLRRWFLTKDREHGSVYIHETLRSDAEDELHDHPGASMSIVLKGMLREILPNGERMLAPGAVVIRESQDRHRLEVIEPSVTMFIMGDRERLWGFWAGETFTDSQTFFRQRGYF